LLLFQRRQQERQGGKGGQGRGEHHEMSERWREILQQLTSELERQTVTGLEKRIDMSG